MERLVCWLFHRSRWLYKVTTKTGKIKNIDGTEETFTSVTHGRICGKCEKVWGA